MEMMMMRKERWRRKKERKKKVSPTRVYISITIEVILMMMMVVDNSCFGTCAPVCLILTSNVYLLTPIECLLGPSQSTSVQIEKICAFLFVIEKNNHK
jgi:hypothetical protein